MKTRFINVIGSRLRISLRSGPIEIGDYPIDYELDNNPEGSTWDSLKTRYPDMIGCGFIRRYNTESGTPEPGDMFYADWYPENREWDNEEVPGTHLIVVLPNGHPWDVDSRASNCDMKEDRNHRCWCRYGTPPNITVNKVGVTCNAGAGSILVPGYHGFLTNGELTNC